jgi:hypothetical protein
MLVIAMHESKVMAVIARHVIYAASRVKSIPVA